MKIGILGTGNIAKTMACTILKMNTEAKIVAVGSRSLEKAQEFAEKFHILKAYGSYEELAKDKEIDLIYIATPHSHHYIHTKLCLEHGKHVLCEKAFTVNERQAEELFKLAESRQLLLTEAIWTRYMPIRAIIKEVAESQIVGNIYHIQANLGYRLNEVFRMKSPELAGGALLDLGVYPINFVLMVFGTKIKSIATSAVLTEKGVDAQNSIILTYEDGREAVIYSTMTALTDGKAILAGEKGYIEVENINNPLKIRVYNENREVIKVIERPEQISGYEYEVEACLEAWKNKKLECPQMTHQDTLFVMRLMDKVRKEWGMKYPCEE